jgi:hypothetical protein
MVVVMVVVEEVSVIQSVRFHLSKGKSSYDVVVVVVVVVVVLLRLV